LALDKGELKKLLKEKGVKSLDDFNAFMREISKEVVETLLEGELTDHLGYEKHDQKATDNARNGFTSKTVKSKFGEIDLEVPRERQSDFETSSSLPSSIPTEIPARVFTTNPIESLNRQIKKTAKNKAIFPNDQALIKQVYLAIEEASKKWIFRHREWAVIYSQLMIYFGERLAEQA
jgi:transposase-like protein